MNEGLKRGHGESDAVTPVTQLSLCSLLSRARRGR